MSAGIVECVQELPEFPEEDMPAPRPLDSKEARIQNNRAEGEAFSPETNWSPFTVPIADSSLL